MEEHLIIERRRAGQSKVEQPRVSKAQAYYLVLDQGGHSNRVAVVNARGQIVVQRQQCVATTVSGDRVEQDPEEIIASFRALLAEVYQSLKPADQQRLCAVGLVCQRSSIVAWHRNTLEALSPVISWQDHRAASLLEDILGRDNNRVEIFSGTGLRANAHLAASKIAWSLRYIPAVVRALVKSDVICAPLASYCIAKLCVEKTALLDHALAARSLLWNPADRDWSAQLLAMFAIPRHCLPETRANIDDYGHIAVAEQLRLPLRYVNGDQNAAFFAQGPLQGDTIYINVGTGAFCAARAPEVISPQCTLLRSLVYQGRTEEDREEEREEESNESGGDEGREHRGNTDKARGTEESIYMLEGTVNGAASAIDWGIEYFNCPLDYAAIAEALQQNPELLSVPIFINAVAGIGSPFWRRDIKPHFSQACDDPLMGMVGIVESIVFLMHQNILAILEQGVEPRKISIGGGLSQLDGMCQRLADLCRYPVHRAAEKEATILGAAYCMAGFPDDWGDERAGNDKVDDTKVENTRVGADRVENNSGGVFYPQASSIDQRYRQWLAQMMKALSV